MDLYMRLFLDKTHIYAYQSDRDSSLPFEFMLNFFLTLADVVQLLPP